MTAWKRSGFVTRFISRWPNRETAIHDGLTIHFVALTDHTSRLTHQTIEQGDIHIRL
jgi:hypothetical protein